MTGVLMLESLTRGNTLKQGDKTPLTYKLLDADGDNLNIAGKPATVRLAHPNYLTIGYEKSGLIVSQDDTVTFTIDKIIPSRKYNVEIIVDDKFVFPSRSSESKFTIDKSTLGTEANIIEIVGVDAVVRKAVDLINEDPNLIIDEDKLISDTIANISVGPRQTTFIKTSSNLLNVNERENGYRTNLSTGSLESHLQFAVSDFIPVNPNKEYTMYGIERYSLYDSDKNHISSVMWNYPTDIKTTTTTYETRFIRVSFRQSEYNSVYSEVRLNEGGELLPYEAFYKPILDKDKVEIDFDFDNINSQLEDNSVEPKHTTFIKVSSNLLNVNERQDGYRTNLTDGSLESHLQFAVSDFIPVKKGTQYTMYGVERYSLYDADMSHISSVMWNYPTDIKTTTTTNETRFIRVSFRQWMYNTVYSEVRLNEGGELLPYEDYESYLDSSIMINADSIVGSSNGSSNTGGIQSQSYVYTSPLLEGGTPPTSAEVIALFDTLVDGEYVTKKIWGQDDFGNDLVSYKASKPNMETTTGLEPLRFGFSSGTHGIEQNTAVGLYHFLKDLIENKDKNLTFMKIQSSVELHWYPQVNPSGWNNFTYHNGNDVDIHRNFSTDWNGVPSPVNGSGPASEPETKAVEAWLSESKLDYYFDIHTTVAIDDSWMAVAEQGEDAVEGKKLIEDYYKTRSFLSNWWGEREDIDFPKNTMMGYVRDYNPTGRQYAHAWKAEGANSLLLELADRYSPDVTSRGPVTNTFSAETIGNLFLQIVKRNFDTSKVGKDNIIEGTIDYDLLDNDLKDFYDSFAITNLLENGNFSNGLSGWTVNAGSPTVESGMLNVSGTVSNQLKRRFGDTTDLSGHTFYISAKANCTRYVRGTLGVQLLWRDNEAKTIGLTQPSNGETIISGIFNNPTSHPFEIYVGSMLQANLDGVIGDIILIDLTATFGIGKEPDKQFCDNIFGGEYFEDTKRFGLLESHISLSKAISNPEEVDVSPEDAKAAFVSKMNERAAEIGMTNSYFVNADGTPTGSHVSTSLDLLKMGIQATGYPELMRVWNKKQYDVLVQGANPRSLTINTTVSDSALDNHYFVIGGKTGSWLGGIYKTDNVLVIAESDNEWYIASVLNANENRFKVAKELIDIARGDSALSDVNAEKASVAKVPKHSPFPYEGKDISLDFSKNENQSGYPASVTKVLTALVTLNVVKDLNQRFEIKSSDITSGSGPTLSGGDIITFKDALYLLMLPSSNTTATALSRVVGEMIVRNNQKLIS